MQCIELERAPQSLAAWSRTARRVNSGSHRPDSRAETADDAGDSPTTRVDDLLFAVTAFVGGPILVVAGLLLS